MIKRLLQSSKAIFISVLSLSLFYGFYHTIPIYAAINERINFQGKLVDNNSLNVANGTYSITFTLYDAASGGTNLWDETQNVAVEDGIFRVSLGDVDTTLGNVDFDSANLYLGIKVGSDAEMSPRIRFTAVPYAFQAKSATNVKWSGITAPSDNLALSMEGYTSTFTYGATTGSNNLFNLTDTTSNTGTGYLLNLATATGSTLKPFHVSAAGTEALIVDASGNVGIGDTTPDAKFTVGSTSQFRVSSTGDLTRINDVAYSWPSTQAGGAGYVLSNDGAGNLSWVAAGGTSALSSITAAIGTNSIDSSNYGQTWDWSTLSTQTALSLSANAITSGSVLNVSSSSTAFTGTLAGISLTGSNAANTGTLFKVSNTGTLNTGTALMVTNLGTGLSFRVNDQTGDADTTPFVIDASGNVGVGIAAPTSLLDIKGSNPILTMTNSSQGNSTWKLRHGGTGSDGISLGSAFSLLSSATTEAKFVVRDDGRVLIGTDYNRGGPFNPSRVFIYGGANGANVDIMGEPVTGRDQAITDLQSSDFETSHKSTYLINFGPFGIAANDTLDMPSQNLGALVFANDSAVLGTALNVDLNFATHEIKRMVLDANGNLGIGDLTPTAMLTVGSGDAFQVNSSGAIAAATGITSSGTITFSGLTASKVVFTDSSKNLTSTGIVGTDQGGTGLSSYTTGDLLYASGTNTLSALAAGTNGYVLTVVGGVPTWSAPAGVSADSLDFIDFEDTLDLDAALTLNQTTNTWSQTFTGTTTTGFTYTANSLTSGKAQFITSSATGLTGNLLDISLTGSNAGNTGTLFRVSNTGTLNTGTAAMITNLGIGESFRVNDETGDADSTPFIIDASGNVGVGDANPSALLTVGNGDLFQVNSSGAIAAATGITSSGTINFSGLAASSVVYTDASKNLTTTAPTSGTIGYWSRSGNTLSPATAGDAITTSGNISTTSSGTLSIAGTSSFTGLATMTAGFDANAASTVAGLTVDGSGNLTVSDGLTSLTSSATTAATKALQVSQTGATSGTDYAGYFTNTGAATTNVAGYFSATGGTNNYAAIFENGNVGIGDTTPASLFTVGSGDLFQINSTGNVGILGTPNTNFALNVAPTWTATSGTLIGGRYAITATPGSASSASYRAGFFQQDITGTNTVTGTVMGLNVSAQKSSTGTTDTEYNGLAASITSNAGTITTARNTYQIITGGGNITLGRAIEARIRNTGAGTIGTSTAYYVRTPENSGGGSLTTNYGLYVEDLNVAGANYALFTNAGLNRLGDQLSVVGSADRIQLIVRANGTQTTNLQEWQNSSSTPIASLDADGDIKPRNVDYSWPSANASGVLTNNGSGTLTWGTLGGSSITADSLDFTEFEDTLDLDAALTLNQTTNTWSQTFTGTTTTGLTYTANSLTSGSAYAISSSATGFTGTLSSVSLTGNNAANTGTLFKVSNTGAANTGTAAMITNLGTGTSFRVNDETGDADTTPFIIDASGNVGIGTASPSYKVDVSNTSAVRSLNVNSAVTSTSQDLYGVYSTVNLDSGFNRNQYAGYFHATGTGGVAFSYGIYAKNDSSWSGAQYGIYTESADGYALYAQQNSSTGYGIYSNGGKNTFSGATMIGTGTLTANRMLDVQGRTEINLGGTQTSTALCGSHSAGTGASVSDVEIVDCTGTPAADYMEMYPVDAQATLGDIVVPTTLMITTKDGEEISRLTRSNGSYEKTVIGIVSDKSKAGDFNSIGHNIKDQDNPQPIALAGRVPVKISSSSQSIQPGDFITTSSELGKGMKATKPGHMVGRAIESWSPNSGKSTVMIFVTNTFADPQGVVSQFALNEKGELVITAYEEKFANQTSKIASLDSNVLGMQATQSAALGSFDSEIKNIKTSLTSFSSLIASLAADVKSLGDWKSQADIDISSLKADIAYLKAENGLYSSSPSATLLTPLEATLSAITITDNANINNLGVTGSFTAGLVTIDGLEGQINTLSNPLKLQALSLGTVEIMGGKIDIDKKGTLALNEGQIKGNDSFRGKATMQSGQTEIRINQNWETTPVTINITSTYNTKIWVEQIDKTGFTVKVDMSPSNDKDIYWVAFW